MSNELVDQGAQALDVGKNALQDVGGYASLSMIKRRFDDQNIRGFTTRCKHLVKPQKKKISLCQNDGRRKVWRGKKGAAHDSKHSSSSVKHSGASVLAANGTGTLVFMMISLLMCEAFKLWVLCVKRTVSPICFIPCMLHVSIVSMDVKTSSQLTC